MITVRDMMMNQTQFLPLSYYIFTQGLVGVNLKVLSIASADSETAACILRGWAQCHSPRSILLFGVMLIKASISFSIA